MIITETFTVAAPRATVAALLTDVERVAACVPGVENLSTAEPEVYEATLRIQVGPIRSAFAGRVRLDSSGAPGRLRATAEGRDRSTQSTAKVAFAAELEESGAGETRVDATADVTIRGRLGQFGTGVIQATAAQMLSDFAACLNAHLGTETASPPPRQPSLRPARALALALWARLASLVRSLREMGSSRRARGG